MTRNSSFHFDAIAIVRIHKTRTDQQEDNICAFQMLVQFFFSFRTSAEVSVAPDNDLASSLQRSKMLFQLCEHFVVIASIATEDFQRVHHLITITCFHQDLTISQPVLHKKDPSFISIYSWIKSSK